jgi:hypothetical protein
MLPDPAKKKAQPRKRLSFSDLKKKDDQRAVQSFINRGFGYEGDDLFHQGMLEGDEEEEYGLDESNWNDYGNN